jgi:hypothetical protein
MPLPPQRADLFRSPALTSYRSRCFLKHWLPDLGEKTSH